MAGVPISQNLFPVLINDFAEQNFAEYDISAAAIMAPIFQLSVINAPTSGIRIRLLQSIEPKGDFTVVWENDKPLSFLIKSDGVRNLAFSLTNGVYYRLQAEGTSGQLSVKVQDRFGGANVPQR
jgi:hypothetical protein